MNQMMGWNCEAFCIGFVVVYVHLFLREAIGKGLCYDHLFSHELFLTHVQGNVIKCVIKCDKFKLHLHLQFSFWSVFCFQRSLFQLDWMMLNLVWRFILAFCGYFICIFITAINILLSSFLFLYFCFSLLYCVGLISLLLRRLIRHFGTKLAGASNWRRYQKSIQWRRRKEAMAFPPLYIPCSSCG